MTIEITVTIISSSVREIHEESVNQPLEITKVLVIGSTVAGYASIAIRDSTLPPTDPTIGDGVFVENDSPNELSFKAGYGATVIEGFTPIGISQKVAIDIIGSSGSPNFHLTLFADALLGDDQISKDLTRDLLQEQTQVGKPQIHFDEATGTYLDQDGNTVDFSDQEQILSRSVRQITRSEQ